MLSGEEPPRIWREPVALIDVVRAAIAETEDLDRVSFSIDESLAVLGHTVTDLTHVLAELTENAVRFSPPEAHVTVRTRRFLQAPGATVLTVEDWGVGMRPDDLAQANELLAHPREVDLLVSQRLGLHVVARLATRHGIAVSLSPTPGSGVTAVVVIPAELLADELLGPVPGTPQPRMVPPRGAAHDGQLHRRVPQANLAPELRRARPVGEVVIPARNAVTQDDAWRARDALSRYQASRLTALHEEVAADSQSRSCAFQVSLTGNLHRADYRLRLVRRRVGRAHGQ